MRKTFIIFAIMRITSGIARGLTLSSPKTDATRPATDAARLAIFSSLGAAVEGAEVLDLFAGTGAYAMEALSRGAKSATFAENAPAAVRCIEANLKTLSKVLDTSKCSILRRDAFKCAELLEGRKFDIVFADPPYAMLSEKTALEKILKLFCRVNSEGTIFVLESPAQFELPEELGGAKFAEIKRLGKKSKGKPSQIVFRIER